MRKRFLFLSFTTQAGQPLRLNTQEAAGFIPGHSCPPPSPAEGDPVWGFPPKSCSAAPVSEPVHGAAVRKGTSDLKGGIPWYTKRMCPPPPQSRIKSGCRLDRTAQMSLFRGVRSASAERESGAWNPVWDKSLTGQGREQEEQKLKSWTVRSHPTLLLRASVDAPNLSLSSPSRLFFPLP